MADYEGMVDELLDPEIFGETARYKYKAGESVEVNIIFDHGFVSMQGIGETGVESTAPTALCKTSSIPDAQRGDSLKVGEVTYYVNEIHPDGMGISTLILSRDQ